MHGRELVGDDGDDGHDVIDQFTGPRDGEEKVKSRPDPSIHNIAMVPELKDLWFPGVLAIDKVSVLAKKNEKNAWNLSLIKRMKQFPDMLIVTNRDLKSLCDLPEGHKFKVRDEKDLTFMPKHPLFRSPWMECVFPLKGLMRFGNWTQEDPPDSKNDKQIKTKSATLAGSKWTITLNCRPWRDGLEVDSITEESGDGLMAPRKSLEQYHQAGEFVLATRDLHEKLVRSVFTEAQENTAPGARLSDVSPFKIMVTKARKQTVVSKEPPVDYHCRVTSRRLPTKDAEFDEQRHPKDVWTHESTDDEGNPKKFVVGDVQIVFVRRCFKRAFGRHDDEKKVANVKPEFQEMKRQELLEKRLKEYRRKLPKEWTPDIVEQVIDLFVTGVDTQSGGSQYLEYDPFEVVDFATKRRLPMSAIKNKCVMSIEGEAEYYFSAQDGDNDTYQGLRYGINKVVVLRAAPKFNKDRDAAEELVPSKSGYEYDMSDAVSAVPEEEEGSEEKKHGGATNIADEDGEFADVTNDQMKGLLKSIHSGGPLVLGRGQVRLPVPQLQQQQSKRPRTFAHANLPRLDHVPSDEAYDEAGMEAELEAERDMQ